MFYSKTTGGFYDKEIHKGGIPTDAVEISDEYHAELMAGQAAGQMIVADGKGFPRLENRPELTPEETIGRNNMMARKYLAETDWYVIRKTETGEEIPQEILDLRAQARLSVVE